jgi:hypothetical protein
MASAFRSTWIGFLLAFVVLALSVGAFAQGGQGQLTGRVTDTSGAVVSGVEIKLIQVATGEVRTTITTPAGTYNFPALPIVGAYTLEIASKGFKSVKVQNIVATVGQITTRDIQLEIGAASEQITVEAGSQLVQTEDASLSQNVDSNVWQNMPLEDRSSNGFLALVAGSEPAANADLGTDRGPAINGTRSGSGNFLVEGFSNNDQGLGGAGSLMGPGGSNTTISPDAIQEYRVIDGTPPAEYGQAGGFVTDTVLKGGTNQWHGSLFEYNRIQLLAANSWFSNQAGIEDHLVRNQFGGSVGGPVVKDKTFFFFTTEFQRLRVSSPDTFNTTTQAFENFVNSGAFATFMESDTGQTSPSGGFCYWQTGATCPGAFSTNALYSSNGTAGVGNSTTGAVYNSILANEPIAMCGATNCTNTTTFAQGLWTGGIAQNEILCPPGSAAYPCPGITPVNPLGATGFQYPVPVYGTLSVPQPDDVNQARYTVKFDHKLDSKNQLNVAYLYENVDTTEAYGGNADFGPTLFNHGRAQNAGVTWSYTVTPTVLNQARMAYVRHTSNFPGSPAVAGDPSILTFFDEPTFGLGNSSALPQLFTENEFIWKDDLSVAHGKSNFKGGGEFRRTRNGSSFDAYKNGYLIVDDLEDMMTDATFTENLEQQLYGGPVFGSIGEAFASLNPTTGALPEYYRGYRANEVAAYVQDDWRVHPRLTVNLGLRWEYFGPPHNFQPGLDANFYQGTPVTPFATPAPSCSGTPAVCTATNPFLPIDNPGYALFATGSVQQRNNNIWAKQLNNFGPRFGFAYDALGNQKLVVRGGFGINYDRMYNNIFENIRFNPPFFAIGQLGTFGNGTTIGPTETSALWQSPFTPTGTSSFLNFPLTPSIRAVDQNLKAAYYEQAHLGFQYQIGKSMVVESNYVGTFGHRLMDIEGRNTYDGAYVCPASGAPYAAGSNCADAGLANGTTTPLINPNYGNISFRTNCCDSNYHGWQTTLRRRFTNGLEFNANYTYAKAMDDVSDAFTTKNAGGAAYPTDSWNPKLDYGPADFNVKHRIVTSFVYDLPFAKGNRWIGGFQFTGIVSWQTGADFSIINSSVDSNGDNQFNDRAVYLGPGKITNAIDHNVSPATGYLNDNPSYWGSLNGLSTANQTGVPCAANFGLWCNNGEMQRNSLSGPSFFNTDLGFHKAFKINERASVRVEGNLFNIFNHPNFLPPDLISDGANLDSVSFGKSLATFTNQQSGGPRITQLALRLDF